MSNLKLLVNTIALTYHILLNQFYAKVEYKIALIDQQTITIKQNKNNVLYVRKYKNENVLIDVSAVNTKAFATTRIEHSNS